MHPGLVPDVRRGASPGTPSTTEDCLFLNVTVPGNVADMGFWQNKPVLVFFHGGGTGGSGDVYDAKAMASENDVIVVTINYRLGRSACLRIPRSTPRTTSSPIMA